MQLNACKRCEHMQGAGKQRHPLLVVVLSWAVSSRRCPQGGSHAWRGAQAVDTARRASRMHNTHGLAADCGPVQMQHRKPPRWGGKAGDTGDRASGMHRRACSCRHGPLDKRPSRTAWRAYGWHGPVLSNGGCGLASRRQAQSNGQAAHTARPAGGRCGRSRRRPARPSGRAAHTTLQAGRYGLAGRRHAACAGTARRASGPHGFAGRRQARPRRRDPAGKRHERPAGQAAGKADRSGGRRGFAGGRQARPIQQAAPAAHAHAHSPLDVGRAAVCARMAGSTILCRQGR
jgi:hypothetical protein